MTKETKEQPIEDAVFIITKEDLQDEAFGKLGRKLTDEELEKAKKGIHLGILTSIDIIYNAIFDEMNGFENPY